MFDLSFGELLLIALVALVVLGPERLPRAARFAGLWVRRARAQWYSVKSELEREMAADELKRSLDSARTAATDFEREAREAVTDLDQRVREKGEAARKELAALRDELAAGVEPGAADDAGDAGAALPPPGSTGEAGADAGPSAGTGEDAPPSAGGGSDGRG